MAEAKYDSMTGGRCFKEVEGAFELECENILGGGGEFLKFARYEVANRSKIRF
jgi:hypothetical protein